MSDELTGLHEDQLPAMFRQARGIRNAHGNFSYNGIVVADTLRCPHCGGHFIPMRGIPLPFCTKHGTWLCGEPACLAECVDADTDSLLTREV